MRVLMFFSANLSTGGGSAVRARLIAAGLRGHGASVCVVSSGVPTELIAAGIESRLLYLDENWESVLLMAAEEFKPDILYGITEAGADSVKRVAVAFGIPFAIDLHGLGVVEIIDLGSGYGSRIRRMGNSLKWLFNVAKADAITIANPTLLPVVSMINKKVASIFGISDVSCFSPDGAIEILGNDRSKVQVLYAGNYFKWQGVALLIDAIKILVKTNAPFEFTLMGSIGRNESLLEKWKIELPEDRVHFLESVDYNQVADYYRAADVLVIPRPFMLSTYLAFPQKLVDYMATGKAIVATDISPHRWAIESSRSGVLCPPTAEGLADGLLKTLDSCLRAEVSANARLTAMDRFCHIKQSRVIHAVFSELV